MTEIESAAEGPRLGTDHVFYRTQGGYIPEPQGFRLDDAEVIMAEYDFRREIHPYDQRGSSNLSGVPD